MQADGLHHLQGGGAAGAKDSSTVWYLILKSTYQYSTTDEQLLYYLYQAIMYRAMLYAYTSIIDIFVRISYQISYPNGCVKLPKPGTTFWTCWQGSNLPIV